MRRAIDGRVPHRPGVCSRTASAEIVESPGEVSELERLPAPPLWCAGVRKADLAPDPTDDADRPAYRSSHPRSGATFTEPRGFSPPIGEPTTRSSCRPTRPGDSSYRPSRPSGALAHVRKNRWPIPGSSTDFREPLFGDAEHEIALPSRRCPLQTRVACACLGPRLLSASRSVATSFLLHRIRWPHCRPARRNVDPAGSKAQRPSATSCADGDHLVTQPAAAARAGGCAARKIAGAQIPDRLVDVCRWPDSGSSATGCAPQAGERGLKARVRPRRAVGSRCRGDRRGRCAFRAPRRQRDRRGARSSSLLRLLAFR